MNWDAKFKAEYDYARSTLADRSAFDKDWRTLIASLDSLMSPLGFDADRASALTTLRKRVKEGESKFIGHKKAGEDEGILRALGAWKENSQNDIDGITKMRAAALKMLRHVYLLNRWGSKKVWVHSLPKTFTNWASDYINAHCATDGRLKAVLRSDDEEFSLEARKHLAHATQHAMAWCHKTGSVLASAGKSKSSGSSKAAARALVRRWFADPATSETDLDTYIGTLTQGFKDIVARLGKGHFILTDWVPLRGASVQEELRFLNAEAFTFASSSEGLDVVYIERSFFKDYASSVLAGQKNWVRVLVHELTHLVCGTTDVVNGKARYAWYGIGPHAGYPGSQCIRNADNWAFFAADCGGILTDSERNKALKII